MTQIPVRILGAPGSPYSRKMRAVVRYRQIPYRWVLKGSRDDRNTPQVPVDLIPVLVFPDGSAMIDSSFQIERLEKLFTDRSLRHPNPGLAFIDRLLEDFADEWVTKCMFHYRWAFAADIAKAGTILPLWRQLDVTDDKLAPLSRMISERQVGRLGVVGSNPTTAALIERSYRELLAVLDALLQRHSFLMGDRPGAGDFGLFGQLTQLGQLDPTAVAVAHEESIRVLAWLDVMEDLSGFEVSDDGWLEPEQARSSLGPMLELAGRYYAPFLLANAAALESGAGQVDCEIAGERWQQQPFPYQGKCLRWLRESYAELNESHRRTVDQMLANTGCDSLFAR